MIVQDFRSAGAVAAVLVCLVLLAYPGPASAQDGPPESGPSRYGLAGVWGKTFDPVSDIQFFQVAGTAFWDYDPIWRDWAPESMKFKIEGTAGAAYEPQTRVMLSLAMVAHYELDFMAGARLVPYLEGGLGVAYTDFQVTDPEPSGESQGSRFNFNPVVGIGLEFKANSGDSYFAAVRLSHLSNAGLASENRGVNAVVFQIGRFFGKHR